MAYSSLQSLFIVLLKLSQNWAIGVPLSCPLDPFDSMFLLQYSSLYGSRCPGSSCSFSAPIPEPDIFQKSIDLKMFILKLLQMV
jgi:hypothetical protein